MRLSIPFIQPISFVYHYYLKQPVIKQVFVPLVISGMLGLSACSTVGVYQIDLPQGTPISQTQAKKVQVGMTKQQVLYFLGSPALQDTLAPNRWDYVYDYTPGTYGKRKDKNAVHNASQHLTIYFDAAGNVKDIQGITTLPI